jgi:hypothetical protein
VAVTAALACVESGKDEGQERREFEMGELCLGKKVVFAVRQG